MCDLNAERAEIDATGGASLRLPPTRLFFAFVSIHTNAR